MRRIGGRVGVVILLAAAWLLPAPPASAAWFGIQLCAKAGTLRMPDGAILDVWGFARKPSTLACSASSVRPQIPGPPIQVRVGDTVRVTLFNALTERVSIVFPGQSLPPDTTGVAPGGSRVYRFVASRPGSFLYGPGTNVGIQTAMGLYGGLVVRPTSGTTAYGTAASDYSVESLLVLSEMDPALNADPTGFDLTRYRPRYWLINGKAFPETQTILAPPGRPVLLRYLNAGLRTHTMALLGMHQTVVARDGYPLDFPVDVVAEGVPPGGTVDAVGTVPDGTTRGIAFALYAGELELTNSNDFPGGMLTFVRSYGQTFSPATDGMILGTAYGAEDVISFNGSNFLRRTTAYVNHSLLLDGSDLGMGTLNVDGAVVVDGDTLLLSIAQDASLPGIGAVDDSDIVRFDGTLGPSTAGTFSMYFDGSDVGLTTDAEDVDAFEVLEDGRLLVSTFDTAYVSGLASASDEDLMVFTPTSLGPTTAGTWAMYFDGSDVGLGESGNEDVDAVSVADNGDILLSTRGNANVPGASFADEDVFACTPTSAGMTTKCFYSPQPVHDGSVFGIGVRGLDALSMD